jgi:hypothetical protein
MLKRMEVLSGVLSHDCIVAQDRSHCFQASIDRVLIKNHPVPKISATST